MIYGEDSPYLLKFYRGVARRNLACRLVYKKYAGHLGARGLNAIRYQKKSYEYHRLIDEIRLDLVGCGLTFPETTKFLQDVGWV